MTRRGDDGGRMGIGEAMREALGQRPIELRGARAPGDEPAPLFNRARRSLFFLCHDLPGAHLRLLARWCGVDQTTARWHIARLVRDGYLVSEGSARYACFGPRGLLDGYAALGALHRPGCMPLLSAAAGSPGSGLSALARLAGESPSNALAKLRALEAAGWVARSGQGYVATGKLERVSSEWADALPGYTGALAVRLERQGILVQRRSTRAGIAMSLDLGQEKERRTIRRDAIARMSGAKA